MTSACKCLNYAKVCGEVNLDSKFPDSFDLNLPNEDCITIEVKYPWLPLKCKRCMVFGHSDDHCPSRPKEPSIVTLEVNVVESPLLNTSASVSVGSS